MVRIFHRSVNDVSRMFKGCYKAVTGISQEYFSVVSRMLQGCCKIHSKMFQGCIQDVFKSLSGLFCQNSIGIIMKIQSGIKLMETLTLFNLKRAGGRGVYGPRQIYKNPETDSTIDLNPGCKLKPIITFPGIVSHNESSVEGGERVPLGRH